jgi:hypothetical protein
MAVSLVEIDGGSPLAKKTMITSTDAASTYLLGTSCVQYTK